MKPGSPINHPISCQCQTPSPVRPHACLPACLPALCVSLSRALHCLCLCLCLCQCRCRCQCQFVPRACLNVRDASRKSSLLPGQSARPPAPSTPRPPSSPTILSAARTRRPPLCNAPCSPVLASMCTKVVHQYSCGHSTTDKAPCAASRSANCGVSNVKVVKHDEKCDGCER